MFISLRDIWLCQICAETREMWKKTGAWFYKSLPNYTRPQSISSTRSVSLTSSGQSERVRNRGINVNNSSSDEYDEDIANEPTTSIRCNSVGAKRSNSYILERMNSLRSRRPSNSTSSLNDDSFFYRKLSSLNLFGRSPSTLKCDTDSSLLNADISSIPQSDSSCNGSMVRRDSELSTFSVSETSSTTELNITAAAMNPMSNQMCRTQPMGWLDVSLTYNKCEQTLDCFLLRARDLPTIVGTDITCPPDPYARLNIVMRDRLKQKNWLQTRTVQKTRCPEFNETVRFLGVQPDDLVISILYVVILDDDKYGSDFLGTAKIHLGPVSYI